MIGNAVSVSVAEMLLRPLTDLFEQGEYPDYPYPYSWQLRPSAPLRPLEQQDQQEMDVEADHRQSARVAKPNGMLHHESDAEDEPNGTLHNESDEEGLDDDDAAVAQDDEEEEDDDGDGGDGHADDGTAQDEDDEELSHEGDDGDDDDNKQEEDDDHDDVAEEGDDEEDEEDDQAEIDWSHVFIANRPERPPSPPATAYDELTEKYKMIYWV